MILRVLNSDFDEFVHAIGMLNLANQDAPAGPDLITRLM